MRAAVYLNGRCRVRLLIIAWTWTLVGVAPDRCGASVVVLANRTRERVVVNSLIDDQSARAIEIPAGDARPLVGQRGIKVRIGAAAAEQEFELDPDCAYYIGTGPHEKTLVLEQIGLGESQPRKWTAVAEPPLTSATSGVITVKILVDDNESRRRSVWEPILRQRIADASEVLIAHAGVRLEVVATDVWNSDDKVKDFEQSLREFEQKVIPAPARLAIGFSSQYTILPGRTHVGGTRGPLRGHILLKERAGDVLESERLELLVHELGHFLGAAHSPEPTSAMRPVLSDGVMRLAGAKVAIDPVNTLLMSLEGQEIRQRPIQSLGDLSPETRRRMGEIYTALNPTLPNDPAAGQFLAMLASASALPLIDDAQHVLAEIVHSAQAARAAGDVNSTGGAKGRGDGGESTNLTIAPSASDELLQTYVRQAARTAQRVRQNNRERAFLLAVGVALDDSGALRDMPSIGDFEARFEAPQERTERLAAVRQPTMQGSTRIARNFFVAAHLAALVGGQMARSTVVLKELCAPRRGAPWSFDDVAANRAGLAFAAAVMERRLSLDDLAQQFTAAAFLPPLDEVRSELGDAAFPEALSGADDSHLNDCLLRIDARLSSLPVYQTSKLHRSE